MSHSVKEYGFPAWPMRSIFGLFSFQYSYEITMLSVCCPLSTYEVADQSLWGLVWTFCHLGPQRGFLDCIDLEDWCSKLLWTIGIYLPVNILYPRSLKYSWIAFLSLTAFSLCNCVKIFVQIDGSGRYKLLLDGSLQIIGLYRKDSGVYICTADNGVGRPIQREFQLEVTGKQHTGHQMSHSKHNCLPTICTTCKVVHFNTVRVHEHLHSNSLGYV
jgi:hypothetical protein